MAACKRLRFCQFALLQRALHVEVRVSRETVEYPPVIPSHTAKSKSSKRRRLDEYFAKVRASSVEEKLALLTKQQRMKYVVHPQTFALNADRWYQHFTKTAYVCGLPERLRAAPAGEQQLLSEVRSLACHALLQEQHYARKRRVFLGRAQEQIVAPFLSNLVSGVMGVVAAHNPLLLVSSLDFKPHVNFYWMRGERIIPRGHRSGRVEPIRFQIDDKPHSQIRVPQQLPEFLPLDSDVPAEVPKVNYLPDLLPLFRKQYDNNVFIGSKLGDPCSFGHTQFQLVQDRYHRDRLTRAGNADQIEVGLRSNAIASLFAWTGAQALYQGFWSGEDVSRPFVSQAVITDGRYFSFFCYQLNTVALTSQTDVGNHRKNICWGTEAMPLYQEVKDGRVFGLDDSVLQLLIRFLMNQPQSLQGQSVTPSASTV